MPCESCSSCFGCFGREVGQSVGANEGGVAGFTKVPEFCCAQRLSEYTCQPLVPLNEVLREQHLLEFVEDGNPVPANLEEPETSATLDGEKLYLSETAGAYFLHRRGRRQSRCLRCCKRTGRLSLVAKRSIPAPVRVTHEHEFDAFLGRCGATVPGLPWKLLLAAGSEHAGHLAGGHEIRRVTRLQLVPVTWYRPMTRTLIDAVPPQMVDHLTGAKFSQFANDFEDNISVYLAGVRLGDSAGCPHLGIDCRHFACCSTRLQLFYSPTADATKRTEALLADAAGTASGAGRRCPRYLSADQEHFWNSFVVPDVADLMDDELDSWLHPCVLGSAFSVFEKDEWGGSCCSMLLLCRQSVGNPGVRFLSEGADAAGAASDSREIEQLATFSCVDETGAPQLRQFSLVLGSAGLPLLFRRELSTPGHNGWRPPLPTLVADAGGQLEVVRRWLRATTRRQGATQLLRLHEPQPRNSPHLAAFAQRLDELVANFHSALRHLQSEELPADWSYLEAQLLPESPEASLVNRLGRSAEVVAGIAASMGCCRTDGAAVVDRQQFSLTFVDLETFETTLALQSLVARASLLEQLNSTCVGWRRPAPRFVKSFLGLCDHAWMVARHYCRFSRTQLVADHPVPLQDNAASLRAKVDTLIHSDVLVQLVYDYLLRPHRRTEPSVYGHAVLSGRTRRHQMPKGWLFSFFNLDARLCEEKEAGADARTLAATGHAFAELVSHLKQILLAGAKCYGTCTFCGLRPEDRPSLRQEAERVSAVLAGTSGRSADELSSLLLATIEHSLLVAVSPASVFLVNLLQLWLPAERLRTLGGVQCVWRLPADKLTAVSVTIDDNEELRVSLAVEQRRLGRGAELWVAGSWYWAGAALRAFDPATPPAFVVLRLLECLELLRPGLLRPDDILAEPKAKDASKTWEMPDAAAGAMRAELAARLSAAEDECPLLALLRRTERPDAGQR